MNEKTIRDLYLGKIHPEKSQGYKTEVYREHLEEFCNLYESIKAVLPEERRQAFRIMAFIRQCACRRHGKKDIFENSEGMRYTIKFWSTCQRRTETSIWTSSIKEAGLAAMNGAVLQTMIYMESRSGPYIPLTVKA